MELYFALSGLFNAVTSTVLGLFVYLKNRKAKVNQTFALFCACVAAWGYCYYFWPLAEDRETTLFWFQVLHIGAIYASIAYLHFVATWLGLYQKKKKIIILGYFLASCFALSVFSPLFIRDMVPKFSMKYWAEPGILYHFYLVLFFGYMIYSSYLLITNYKKTTGIKRIQIKYILIGMTLAYIGGSTNYFLWYDINFPPYGNILASAYVMFTAYAIVKQKLFEIKVVLTSLFVTIIGALLFFNAISSTTTFEYAWKGVLFGAFLILGCLLIKSVWREIKQREKMEEMALELREANIKLKKLDKAKSEFISIASHQLRTPLSAIIGYLSMVLEGTYGKINGRAIRPISNVFKASRQLNQLVNALLNVSRIEAGKIKLEAKKISLRKVLEAIIEEFKMVAEEKGLYLKLSIPSPLPQISLDEEKINQVIMNIIDNAIKYTEKGGVTIKCKMKNEKLKIEIADTGLGMDKRQTAKVFEKFGRGEVGKKQWTGGAGLGLFIAKKFVELHQGKIWAESKGKNKGSTFYIELPIE